MGGADDDRVVRECGCGSTYWQLTRSGRILCAHCEAPMTDDADWVRAPAEPDDELDRISVEVVLDDLAEICLDVGAEAPDIVRELMGRSLVSMGVDLLDEGPLRVARVH